MFVDSGGVGMLLPWRLSHRKRRLESLLLVVEYTGEGALLATDLSEGVVLLYPRLSSL